MARIYLVRHGRAAAGWDSDVDPGLDQTGRLEAQAAAASLASLGPLRLLTSPLRRTRETASAFERQWLTSAIVEPRMAEIPSPVADLKARGEWLKKIMADRWVNLGPELTAWRTSVRDALLEISQDAVIATHFVAINVAVGWATNDDRVMIFRPANGSLTVFEHDGQTLKLLRLGQEGESRIL